MRALADEDFPKRIEQYKKEVQGGQEPRFPASGSVCPGARSVLCAPWACAITTCSCLAALPCARGKIAGNEDRRRQNPCGHAACGAQRPFRQGRAYGCSQRLPGRAAMPGGWARFTNFWALPAASSPTAWTTRSAKQPTNADTYTAPTMNSVSTICATT